MKKVMIMCSGLGHVNRGYESFSRELYEELKETNTFELTLLKGAGESEPTSKTPFCFKRNGKTAAVISKITRIPVYDIEQISFFIFSIPHLILKRPVVIIYSDFILGVFLWHLRRMLRLKYKLLFSNGAPNGPPFTRCDHIQQLLPCHFQTAVKGGTPENKQTILPYGIKLSEADLSVIPDKNVLRTKLNLPLDRKIIISVGAINQSHKRMKYLVEEFSHLKEKEYFLQVLGQTTSETPEVMELAAKVLDKKNYSFKTVRQEEINEYYQASDIFVLCSFTEGLPRVSLEAMGQGLPIIIHDYPIARETLGKDAIYIYMAESGTLTKTLLNMRNQILKSEEQKKLCFEKYSWNRLLPAYIEMIKNVSNL